MNPSLFLSPPKSNSNSLVSSAHSQLGYCPFSPLPHHWVPEVEGFCPFFPREQQERAALPVPACMQRCLLCQQQGAFSVLGRASPPDFTKSDRENRRSSKRKAKVSRVRQSTGLANYSNKKVQLPLNTRRKARASLSVLLLEDIKAI